MIPRSLDRIISTTGYAVFGWLPALATIFIGADLLGVIGKPGEIELLDIVRGLSEQT